MVIERATRTERWAASDRVDARRDEPAASAVTRVLVVDDDAAVRRLVALVLVRDGFEVTAAEDGRDAIALSRRRPFDVLLLDVQMPGMDGWGGPRGAVRGAPQVGDGRRGRVPDGGSGHERARRDGRGAACGAATLLRKPFSPAELLAAVRDAVVAGRSGAREGFLAPLAPPDALAA